VHVVTLGVSVTDDFSVRPGASGPPTSTGRVKGRRPQSSKGKGHAPAQVGRCAEEVFNTYGYYDASIVKITEAASVAQGTFYVYFRSKKEIFDESSPISIAVFATPCPRRLAEQRRV